MTDNATERDALYKEFRLALERFEDVSCPGPIRATAWATAKQAIVHLTDERSVTDMLAVMHRAIQRGDEDQALQVSEQPMLDMLRQLLAERVAAARRVSPARVDVTLEKARTANDRSSLNVGVKVDGVEPDPATWRLVEEFFGKLGIWPIAEA